MAPQSRASQPWGCGGITRGLKSAGVGGQGVVLPLAQGHTKEMGEGLCIRASARFQNRGEEPLLSR